MFTIYDNNCKEISKTYDNLTNYLNVIERTQSARFLEIKERNPIHDFVETVEKQTVVQQIESQVCTLTTALKTSVRKFLTTFIPLFATSRFDIGKIPHSEFYIRLKPNAQPRNKPRISISPTHKRELRRQIEILLK